MTVSCLRMVDSFFFLHLKCTEIHRVGKRCEVSGAYSTNQLSNFRRYKVFSITASVWNLLGRNYFCILQFLRSLKDQSWEMINLYHENKHANKIIFDHRPKPRLSYANVQNTRMTIYYISCIIQGVLNPIRIHERVIISPVYFHSSFASSQVAAPIALDLRPQPAFG